MSSTTLAGPRVQPRAQAYTARPAAVPSVLHVDGGQEWGGGQNQVRLLMRELAAMNVRQICICPEGSPLALRLELEGLPVKPVAWNASLDPRALFTIARNLRHYNLVHCHDVRSMDAALVPARVAGRPIVAAKRDALTPTAFKWSLATRVIAVSAFIRDELVSAGIARERVCLVHPGTDMQEVRGLASAQPTLRGSLGLSPNIFVAGSIGALVNLKNHFVITKAAAKAQGVVWVFIGDGPARARIEMTLRGQHTDGRVRLAGALKDARRVLREMDVLISMAANEEFATSLLDAMAAGIPVIASNSAGAAEVLGPVHAETGNTLVDAGDSEMLARMVAHVKEKPELRDAMVTAQNRRIDEFRSERTAMLTLEVYREVLR